MGAVVIRELTKTFDGGKRTALDAVTAAIPAGKITGVVGPDGAGKSTLLRIIAGLMTYDSGSCAVLEDAGHLEENIGYLPQRFGLYEDLTVAQNLSLYCDLQGVSKEDAHVIRLMEFSGLAPFVNRLTGNLSGGMKQKLGLMTALLRRPKLLLLDEPTLGVDPISQKELWKMILELNSEGMTIVAATSYLDEADRCDHSLLFNGGKVLFSGTPEDFKEIVKGKTFYFDGVGEMKRHLLDKLLGVNGIIDTIVEGERIKVTFNNAHPDEEGTAYGIAATARLHPRAADFEDAFIFKLGGVPHRPALRVAEPPVNDDALEKIVEAHHLSKEFGSFKAVNDISFSIGKGEIFGLLGPNGAGKSTTFKMLCGLLRPTEGEALVGGLSLRDASGAARELIGYMAQKFSLYDNMSVIQNLRFFSGIYPVKNVGRSIDEMVEVFDLGDYRSSLAGDLPLGFKQRLALSCCLMHQPQVLFLDEPTSGVDPLTRREFWHQINVLATSGVSILVSTHLMGEAEFCDRIGLIDKGELLVVDTPDRLKARVPSSFAKEPALVDAFLYFCGGGNEV